MNFVIKKKTLDNRGKRAFSSKIDAIHIEH
jgi:hypothetical protein